MTQHTPGPWIADNNEGFSSWSIWSRMTPTGHGIPGPQVASVHGDSAESDADAQLIAAAPELLEALQGALKALDAIGDEMTVGERYTNAGQYLLDALMPARAAIAKATGTTP